MSVDPATVLISFFSGRNSSEPFATRSATLQPNRGGCVAVGYDRVGDTPIFAELTYQVSGVVGVPFTIVRGAAAINGVFEHVPGKARLTAFQ